MKLPSRITGVISCALLTLCLPSAHAHQNQSCSVAPTIIPRSQGRDLARHTVGLMDRIYVTDKGEWWNNLAITAEYSNSFRPHRIAQLLFGADLIQTTSSATHCVTEWCDQTCIRIQGSQVVNRDPNAWLADYFYLAPDFSSVVCFDPKIQNGIIDLDYYLGLDPWLCGTYLRIYGPLTWTKWDLGFCESVITTGTNGFDAGYFSPQAITHDQLLDSFASYARGNAPGLITSAFTNVTLAPLAFARMGCNANTRFGFADLRAEFGWNSTMCDSTLGAAFLVAAPTGTNKHAYLLFEPTIGNGHHWEIGADVHWFKPIWSCDERNMLWNLFLQANVTHLFGTYQERTFDLCNKPMSRYMLAEQLGQPIIGGLTGDNAVSINPSSQFAGLFMPVANITTVTIKSSISVESEIVALINGTLCNWSFDLGYNFWVRSCEKFACPESCNQKNCLPNICQHDAQWGLKGDARIFGFLSTPSIFLPNTPIALSATEQSATIHSGTNACISQAARSLNQGIDNPLLAFGPNNTPIAPTTDIVNPFPFNTNLIIRTSIQPVLLHCQDINFQRSRGLSHKLFGHISYDWSEQECWMPFLGIGGFAEFGKTSKCCAPTASSTPCSQPVSSTNCCNTGDADCINAAISQWGIWIKGGVSF